MNLPMPDLRHLVRMTDDIGLFEHACGAVPRRAHGYCSDDAGRALAVTCRWEDRTADWLSEIYLALLRRLHLGGGRFALRLGHDRRFIDRDVSDDACGRAIFGLGVAATSMAPRHVTDGARELFCKTTSFRSRWPHAMAYAALGAAAVLADDPDQPHAAALLRGAATMIAQATGHRHWPEARLRYANALLPECLLAAGAMLGDTRFERTGLRLLEVPRLAGSAVRSRWANWSAVVFAVMVGWFPSPLSAIRSAAASMRWRALALNCGAAPPCDRQTSLPFSGGSLHGSPVRPLCAVHFRFAGPSAP